MGFNSGFKGLKLSFAYFDNWYCCCWTYHHH